MAWLAFALGLFLGTFLGMLVIGLCQMASQKSVPPPFSENDIGQNSEG